MHFVVPAISYRGPEPRLRAVFGLVVLLLVLLGGVTWRNTSRLVEAAHRVEHTRDVMTSLDTLEIRLTDAGRSEHSYILTGHPDFLARYQIAAASVTATLNRIRMLVADNPKQGGNLRELERLISERRKSYTTAFELRKRSGVVAANANLDSAATRANMDSIRAVSERMQAHERELLRQRSANTTGVARVTVITVGLGGLLFFAFLGVIWFLLGLDLVRRHAAEEKIRTTLRSIGDAVIATDARGRVTFMNPVAERLTGWTEADAVGRNSVEVFRIVNEMTRAAVESPVTRVLREGSVVALANHTTLIGKNGQDFPIADSGAPILGARGELAGVVLVFRDITEARRAERDLQRLGAIVASSEDAIIGQDLNGSVTAWNTAAERLFGYSASEMIGHSTVLLEPADLPGNTQKILARIRSGQAVLQFDTHRVRKDGTTVALSVAVSPILSSDGTVIGASKIARDITERKEVENELLAAKQKAEDANRAKDRFLAVLSHELRTPLTPALAMAQLLERHGGLPAEVTRGLLLIRRNIELEALLVDDLLDLTRIAHGKIELKRESVDVHAAIANVIEICRSDSNTRGQTLTQNLRAGEHHADADPGRLQQVLWNLVKNAIKFTGEGGRVEVATDNPTPGLIRIRVTDTGIGLSSDFLERIFEPFEQASEGASTRYGGLGLGLSISRTLVELHGGVIRAESAGIGKGTTFIVDLTAHVEKRVARHENASSGEAASRRPLSILVVEDHRDTAASLVQLLESEGHAVLVAATVAEAEQLFKQRPCDLVITDLGLPDASGHELLGRLRRVRPVQAVVLSGYGMDADVAASREAGFLEHLTKPVNIRRLLDVIDRASRDMPQV